MPTDESLERWRAYLHLIARVQLAGRSPAKFDASDVVQEALLRAHRQREQYRGTTEAERAAWLRRLLTGATIDAVRAMHADKRDVDRDRSLEAEVAQSSARLEAALAADQSSPSQRAEKHEELVRMAEAMAALPDDQRQAVELRHLMGMSLDEIAERMGRSPAAVAGLLKRGLQGLRTVLRPGSAD